MLHNACEGLSIGSVHVQLDLKTFANWDDSPEKMMIHMMADPNRVQREDC